MGSVVAYINSDHGIILAGISAVKQGFYTFFIGGIIIRILDVVVNKIKKKSLAYIASITLATLLTTGMVYIVHSMKGTPEPLESTFATVVLAPPGYIYLAFNKRKNCDEKDNG